jgi:transposase
MPVETNEVEYRTVQIGAGLLVKGILNRLGVVQAIDQALKHQPEIAASYGTLAQALIINRMSLDPQPLYLLPGWVAEHGIDYLLGIQAEWLDDDRLGAMLEGLADHQVEIWSAMIGKAVQDFRIELEWLHSDTTSVYFEGAYEDEQGEPKREENGPVLVKGYNKDGRPQNVQFVLSLITSKRLPLWYRPWDGNQSDDGVYLADMSALRKLGWVPANVVLIGDRKLCNQDTLLAFCRTEQLFLAAHPWTDTAKAVWLRTWGELQAGKRVWSAAEYVSRNEAHKPAEKRTQYRVCEVEQTLFDEQEHKSYRLRWVFSWSSRKAEQDANKRHKALEAGEQALQRIARLLGKYDYIRRAVIQSRIDQALNKAKAKSYFQYTLIGSDEDQAWELDWERQTKVLTQAERFDGVMLLCTNVPAERLSAGDVMSKYKTQINVEQTIDFIKSPVQIRPMWLHSPKRLAGLTLLIMIAVLVAGLLEYQVRRHVAQTGELVRGLMPENRDNPYPTAKKMLRAFRSYALVFVRHPDGQEEVHYPKLRPVQQQIWNIMQLSWPPTPTLDSG